MDKKKLQKGMYGFLNKKKKSEIIKTILFFGIALAVYFTGLIHTGTNKNLLTIVAIVGVLPASKAAVSMLMFIRYKAASAGLYNKLEAIENNGLMLYDLIFVLNEKVVKTDCIYIRDLSIVVYTENSQMAEHDISKYLKNFLANQGKGNSSIKVCKTEKSYFEQVKSRENMDVSEQALENQNRIRDLLFSFSM